MILTLWTVLLLLSVVALALGYFTGDQHYAYVGLTFLFLLGVVVLTGNLEVESGVTITEAGGTTTVVYDYNNFTGDQSRWFGLLLSFSAAAGGAIIFFNYRKNLGDVG